MSFVDLMANDVWINTDIENKVQSLIRYKISAEDELKAARLSRKLNITQDEIDFINSVDQVISTAINEGRQARYDMALLLKVFDIEAIDRRLNKCEVEPEYDENGNLTNKELIDRDIQEREDSQNIIDNMPPEVKELYNQRNPQTSIII